MSPRHSHASGAGNPTEAPGMDWSHSPQVRRQYYMAGLSLEPTRKTWNRTTSKHNPVADLEATGYSWRHLERLAQDRNVWRYYIGQPMLQEGWRLWLIDVSICFVLVFCKGSHVGHQGRSISNEVRRRELSNFVDRHTRWRQQFCQSYSSAWDSGKCCKQRKVWCFA